MESIEKIETTLAGWLKPLPHLPVNARKWFADNIWWMALVVINLSIIGILAVISFIFSVIALLNSVSLYYSYGASSIYNGWSIVALIAIFIILVVNIGLYALSIAPLQLLQKKGWKYLFKALMLQVVALIIGAILFGSILGFVIGIIGVAIVGYVLFEARSQFTVSRKG
jgi:hypothetical protein